MINGKNCIAVIPARKGSKEVKDKNIRLLNNKPLIAYTIEFALKTKLFDHIIFSTDSEKYAQIAKNYGAEIPFIRPKELAQNDSKAIDVINHSLNWIIKNIKEPNYYCYLQPTTPFRNLDDMNNIIQIFNKKGADAIVSVCLCKHPPHWTFKLIENQKLERIFKSYPDYQNRQDFIQYYRLNGAFYFAKIPFLLKNKSFYSDKTFAYIMPPIRSIDIDTELDFRFAEYLLKTKQIII